MEQNYQIKLNDQITTIGRISHKTGIIDVHPKFYELEPLAQEFILEHLSKRPGCHTKLKSSGADNINNKVCADKSALEIMKQRHPDVPLSYWPQMLENILKLIPGSTVPDDWKRIDNL